MLFITRKSQVKTAVDTGLKAYYVQGDRALVSKLHDQLLAYKVTFPLLEYAAELVFESVSDTDHMSVCDQISTLQTIGGNVIIGKLLQLHLPDRLEPTMHKAAGYIAEGSEWHVSDIIGERVFGHALLLNAPLATRVLSQFSHHPSSLVVRSIGAGVHLALKRGLGMEEAEETFRLLLSLANTKNHQVKRGIGWAAKTTAKFYPEIIAKHRQAIDEPTRTGRWFQTKVKIGLDRNRYAKRD